MVNQFFMNYYLLTAGGFPFHLHQPFDQHMNNCSYVTSLFSFCQEGFQIFDSVLP